MDGQLDNLSEFSLELLAQLVRKLSERLESYRVVEVVAVIYGSLELSTYSR